MPSHTSVKNPAGFHEELSFADEAEVCTGHRCKRWSHLVLDCVEVACVEVFLFLI